MERFSKNLPIERMHAASENGDDHRRRGRVPVRADRSRRRRPDRGRHRRRHVPDASPSRGAAGDDARAARRRARARRAAGAPVGVGGHDLRPLRLRDGVPVRGDVDPEAALGVRAAARARGDAPHRRRGRGARRSSLACGTACAGALPGCSRARATGGSSASCSSRPAAEVRAARSGSSSSSGTGDPEGYAIYRHKPKWEEGVSNSELQVVEAIALDGRPTAELWRYLLDIDWSERTTASLLPVDHPLWWLLATPRSMRPARRRRALGAARRRGCGALRARVRGGRRRRPRRDRRVLPVERRPLARRARPREAHDVGAAAPARRERARQRVPGSVLVLRRSCAVGGPRSCGAVPPRARTRCSRPSALRGVPRSSEP